MTYPQFHPGQFGFLSKDIRVSGAALVGPQSLSGIQQTLKSDGGGRWFAEYTDGAMIDRAVNILWRAVTTAMDDGASPFLLIFCDRLHQPVNRGRGVPHSDGTPFDDASLYASDGASGESVSFAPLRSTTLDATVISELPLLGGERFSIEHPNWGWRAYQMIGFDEHAGVKTLRFRPPLREAVPAGQVLNFDSPRCLMQLTGNLSNALQYGKIGAAGIALVEYMGKPAT